MKCNAYPNASDPEPDPATFSHVYALPGPYLVNATATIDNGGEAEHTASAAAITASIGVPKPKITFEGTTLNGSYTFTPGTPITIAPCLSLDGATVASGAEYYIDWRT